MSEGPYKVGYRQPPLDTRFKKGASGNASGRPKGSRNVSTVIAEALAQTVTVIENGKRRKITKLQAAFTQQANKAAAGDRHSAKLMISLLHSSQAHDDARAAGAPMSADQRGAHDASILAAIKASALNIVPEVSDVPED